MRWTAGLAFTEHQVDLPIFWWTRAAGPPLVSNPVSKTTGPFSTKLGTNFSLVQIIQVYSNEGPSSSLGGDREIVKNTLTTFLILSRTSCPFLTKLGTRHSWVQGVQVYIQMKDHTIFQGKIDVHRKSKIVKIQCCQVAITNVLISTGSNLHTYIRVT